MLPALRLSAVFAMAILLGGCRRHSDLPRLFPVPDATLVSQNATPVSLHALKGNVAVYDFIYTHCAGTCPIMTSSMRRVVAAVREPNVRFVSVSVDPARDTPEVLRSYAKMTGNDPRWLFLTAAPSVVSDLSEKGFKLAAVTGGGEAAQPLLHSSRFALADAGGTIRGYYDGTEPREVDRLIRDIQGLAAE
jgi:protein SCO1/2